MIEPTFDIDGYPTYSTTIIIQNWEIKNDDSARELLDFCAKAWDQKYGALKIKDAGRKYIFITGGWSINEHIIGCLIGNGLFWYNYWHKTNNGGKYVFKIGSDKS